MNTSPPSSPSPPPAGPETHVTVRYFTTAFFIAALVVTTMFSVMLVYQCCAIYRRRRRRRRQPYPPEPPIRHYQQDCRRGPIRIVEKEGVLVLQPDGSTCAVACVEERPAASLEAAPQVYQIELGPHPGSQATPPPLGRHLARQAGLEQQVQGPLRGDSRRAEVLAPICSSDGVAPRGGLHCIPDAPGPQAASGSPPQQLGDDLLLPSGGCGCPAGTAPGRQVPAPPTAAQRQQQQQRPGAAAAVSAPLGPLEAGLAPPALCLTAQGPLQACQGWNAPACSSAGGTAAATCAKGG